MNINFRVGKVSAVDLPNRQVRVMFPDVGITSGWLKVLWNPPRTHYEEDPRDDPPRTDRDPQTHYHKINFVGWFPEVGDCVLCAYNSGFNEDGYVLGALK